MPIYRNPPLAEALAEFYFKPSNWDLVVPGRVYEKLKESFPKRRPHALPNRVVFMSEDERMLIQVAPDLLVVNNVKAYTEWADFYSIIKTAYEVYVDVLGAENLQQLGLQYVNDIHLEADSRGVVPIEDYFEFRPLMGPNLPPDYSLFSTIVQFPAVSKDTSVQVCLNSNPTQSAGDVRLDIKAFTVGDVNLDKKGIFSWLEQSHDDVEKAFEGTLTKKARQLFGKVE